MPVHSHRLWRQPQRGNEARTKRRLRNRLEEMLFPSKMIVAPVFRLSGLPASELKRTNLPPPVTFPNFQMENIRFVDRIVVLSGERKANKKATDRSVALKGSLSGYRDSNSGPPTPEAGALTGLRYIPKTCRTEIVPKHRTGTPPVKELPFSDRRGNKIRTCDPLLPKQVR